ncbi:DMT family transporter [Pantanalinema rosaneae CENA516]|uniref:DMT family transporter n=1 Tax=Pantanalinema rosaneae TaxID=1620701 RepID=UPI003D6EA6A9
MGQMDHQPGNRQGDNRTVEQILQAVTQDLRGLHQGLVTQLSQEVTRLQGEKSRLLADIEKLQTYHQGLQTRQAEALSQQQLAQQQLWAKQLAVALANHLQALMVQQIRQMPAHQPPTMAGSVNPSLPGSANGYSDNAHRLLASLDSTFNATFKTLQQELNSYHSSLSQQLNRMHSMEQQGEAILEALVTRLREQIQLEAARSSAPVLQPTANHATIAHENGHATPVMDGEAIGSPRHHTSHPPVAKPTPLAVPGSPLPLPKKKETSNFQLGLMLVLLSTVALSIHNVVVQIIGNGKFDPVTKAFALQPARVLNAFDVGGFLQLNVGNSLLILWLRMLVVLPLMIPVAMFLYPPLWRDIKKFLTSRDRRPIINVVGSGFFLFLSQILIYIAIGDVGPGPAVTILFMYPIITVPLAWALFGDRPTSLRWIVMVVISCGVVLTALPRIDPSKLTSAGGVLIAVASGVAFAFYLIFMQLGFKKLHPVPVSLVQFSTIFLLSSITLLTVGPSLGAKVAQPIGFLTGGVVLGVLTLIGYLANNFGVRFMGAARASIIASSGPVMTALLAFWIIRSPLQPVQWLGIALVTLGVSALSFERMVTPAQAPKPVPAEARR